MEGKCKGEGTGGSLGCCCVNKEGSPTKPAADVDWVLQLSVRCCRHCLIYKRWETGLWVCHRLTAGEDPIVGEPMRCLASSGLHAPQLVGNDGGVPRGGRASRICPRPPLGGEQERVRRGSPWFAMVRLECGSTT